MSFSFQTQIKGYQILDLIDTGGFVGTTATDIANPGGLMVWDPVSGREITRLEGHPSGVEALAFSPDGSKLLASSGMFAAINNLTTLYYWDVYTGEIIYNFELDTDAYDLAISHDGKTAVIASVTDIDLLDLESGNKLSSFSDYTGMPRSLTFTPSEDQIITLDSNGVLVGWNYPNGSASLSAHVHYHEGGDWSDSRIAMTRVAVSPDGKYALTTAFDNTFLIWDLWDAAVIRKLIGHESTLGGIAITPDGKYILT